MTPAHGLDLLTSGLGAATVDSREWARVLAVFRS